MVVAADADSGKVIKGGDIYYREAQNTPDAELRIEDIPGRMLWLRSDAGVEFDATGKVMVWKDVSSSGREVAQVKPERMPTYNGTATATGPSLRFAGKDPKEASLLTSSSLPLDQQAGGTIAVVAKVENDAGMSQLIGLGPYSIWSGLNYYTTELRLGPKDGSGWRGGCGQWQTVVGQWNPSTRTARLFRNGEAAGTGLLEPSIATNAVFAVGARASDGRFATHMDLAEVVCFNRVLDERERRAVERILAIRHGLGKPITALATELPYAYYPSLNKLEVAMQLSSEVRRQALGDAPVVNAKLTQVAVRVIAIAGQKVVTQHTLALDSLGQAQALIDVPDLPDGEYAVEYVIGKATIRSPKTFKRIHFPWEGNNLGVSHTVLPPFTPVEVRGDTVSVVQRSYKVNGFGLFDSVVSQNCQLLAAPMRVVATDAAGKEIQWGDAKVVGRKLFDDQAVFDCEIVSKPVAIKSHVVVGEDGCARIEWTLAPGTETELIQSLTIEIPVKDSEAPLFHFVGDNSMRLNFGGATPRGGKIIWDLNKKGMYPITWRAESGPEDGVVWDSRQTQIYGNANKADWRPFTPYVWVGAEERGLAWFGESERGWSVDDRQPCQSLARENGRLILRVHVILLPIVVREPRTMTFGLMASPGKPMEPDNTWRTRPVATGVGAAICWGGYTCASKYPDDHDFVIVDKIQEARATGKVDADWFKVRDKKRIWPDRKLFDDPKQPYDWLGMVMVIANHTAWAKKGQAEGTYFEEHATDVQLPEWEVFQDEWASAEFNRFQKNPANWGVFSPSYQDFALYYANEWMKRGVSLYFDNAYPKRCYSPRFSGAWRGDDGVLRFCTTIFEQRDYYRRIYKLMQQWNHSGNAPYRLDFTLHVTNTQTLPMNTWSTALLDLEQRAEPDSDGTQLPWRPDYTRTVTMGRQTGSISFGLDTLRGFGRSEFNEKNPQMVLSNWGMCRVHEVGGYWGYWFWPTNFQALAAKYEDAFLEFGYGKPNVAVHNYWSQDPIVTCDNANVKWIYLQKSNADGPTGLLLLQNYDKAAQQATITFESKALLMDTQARLVLGTQAGPMRTIAIELPADYGTRMFLIADSPEKFFTCPPPANGDAHVSTSHE